MNKIIEAGNDMNKLYVILDNLTGYKRKNKLPEGFNNKELAEKFLNISSVDDVLVIRGMNREAKK